MSLSIGLKNKIRRSRAGGFTILLDQSFAQGATAAYSLRKLKSSATKAVRVREDSGNTETDIGFSGGTLDETALSNHCGSANGFVTKWYDQSGNGNDAFNSTASQQPQIVSSGSLIKENGKPTLDFDGTDDNLESSPVSLSTSDLTVVLVQKLDSAGDGKFNSFFNYKGFVSGGFIFQKNTNDGFRYTMEGNDFKDFQSISSSDGQTLSFLADKSNGDTTHYKNSDTGVTKNISASLSGSGNLAVGYRIDASNQYHNGNIQEIIFYDSDKSSNRQEIEAEINGHYGIPNF